MLGQDTCWKEAYGVAKWGTYGPLCTSVVPLRRLRTAWDKVWCLALGAMSRGCMYGRAVYPRCSQCLARRSCTIPTSQHGTSHHPASLIASATTLHSRVGGQASRTRTWARDALVNHRFEHRRLLPVSTSPSVRNSDPGSSVPRPRPAFAGHGSVHAAGHC
ncbi:uncharacterized protein CC84DRAFT_124748 [Paraphaeosphaeria sporulosa]|uniref:Uncharacterized protein n=1 Tax=Paraphaeosphaeria sporulosa TaxID=1460663 RepID=A0A177CZG8_9PLEO|nr:uncharacterized protein CC84DRAFT_124748 [Paraphaeosphaeria sporulosa]OAG12521.1 hypothetical protein CC84DRAFT_124748 [Paraphaeosphaeria sporulosa]